MSIQRFTGLPLFSSMVIHNKTAYLAGIVPQDCSPDIKVQVLDVLQRIEQILAQAKLGKKDLLRVEIWLKHIERDFAAMNEVWLEWVDTEHLPVRVTSEANLAHPDIWVEVMVTAAADQLS